MRILIDDKTMECNEHKTPIALSYWLLTFLMYYDATTTSVAFVFCCKI